MSGRFLLFLLLAVSLAVAASPAFAARHADSGIELVDGSGRATLTLRRGALLGALERGRILITAFRGPQPPQILVQGADWQQAVDAQTTAYGGQGIRFRVFRGAWRVRITGTGINASAVGRGIVGLAGSGRYSLAGAAYQLWPVEYRILRLGG